jgi:cytosine deaminase
MLTDFDILLRKARLRGAPEQAVDVGIKDGRIAAIGESLPGEARAVIDAAGGLVTESFVNPHLHLCKVWTLPLLDESALASYHGDGMGAAMTAIEAASRVKDLPQYDVPLITANARRATAMAAVHGNLHIRALADVDRKIGLKAVQALLAVRDEFRGVVDLQVTAFAQDGILRDPGTQDLMRAAMEMGADVVGGIPWIEYTDAQAQAHVGICFDLATEFGKDVSMLLDDAGDATLRTLEMMAVEAIERGYQGRALAHHCRAMALYPVPYFHRLTGTLRRAGVSVVSDPHTGPLHARVGDLLKDGVNVALGQDDISDAYYPFGRNNMMEVAFLASHLLWMTTRSGIDTVFDMVTVNAARAMNVANFGLHVGAEANLLVHQQPSVVETLRFHEPPRHVISHGRLLDLQAMRTLAGMSLHP